jgi:hypothetical protein
MNTTKSGSTSVGSPMSVARLQQELEHYFSPMGGIDKFIETDEGRTFIARWLQCIGDDVGVSRYVEQLDMIDTEVLNAMLTGALIGLRMAMVGRVYGGATSEN